MFIIQRIQDDVSMKRSNRLPLLDLLFDLTMPITQLWLAESAVPRLALRLMACLVLRHLRNP